MRDEMDGRFWAEHHAAFSDFVAETVKATIEGFKRLNEIEFAAPWRSRSTSTN